MAASALVLQDHLTSEASHASVSQLVATLVLVLTLVVLAVGRQVTSRPARPRPAPSASLVLLLSVVVSAAYGFAPEIWAGVAMMLGAVVVAGVGLFVAPARAGWNVRHVAAAALGPLVVRALLAFTYFPLLGEVSPAAKYGHNAVLLVLVVALAAIVLSRRPGPDLTVSHDGGLPAT